MAYTPDPRPKLQKATRFFARLMSFDLECPKCGEVYSIRAGNNRRLKTKSPNWDATTGRFTCTTSDCGKVYVLGILAWPVKAASYVASQPPIDQVPNPRQLAKMRREGQGWWMADDQSITLRRPLETNLTTELDRPVAETRAENDDED